MSAKTDMIANLKVVPIFEYQAVTAAGNEDSSEIDLMAVRTEAGSGLTHGYEQTNRAMLIIGVNGSTTGSVITITADTGKTSGSLSDFCTLSNITKTASDTMHLCEIKDFKRYIKFNVAAITQNARVTVYMVCTQARRLPVQQADMDSELTVTYD